MAGDLVDEELTRLAWLASGGDVVATAAFVRATYRDLWRFCAYLDTPDAADDLTQEVFVRALRSLPAYRGESSGRTWLLVIARRTVADAIRSRRRRRLQGRLGRQPEVPDHAGVIDTWELIAALDKDRRAAFVLTQVVGLSYAEAARLGMRLETALAAVHLSAPTITKLTSTTVRTRSDHPTMRRNEATTTPPWAHLENGILVNGRKTELRPK